MRRTHIWLVFAFALTATAGFAQWGGGGGGQRPSAEEIERARQARRAALFDTLQATAEQRTTIDSILDAQEQTMLDLRDEMRMAFGDREIMNEIRQDIEKAAEQSNVAILAILTESQQTLYKALIEEQSNRAERWRQGRGNRRGGDRGAAPPPDSADSDEEADPDKR